MMAKDFQYPAGVPTKIGFYWAKWRLADDGTFTGPGYTDADREGVMSKEFEPVRLVENCVDHDNPEWLKVSVGGVEKSQSPENFIWGPRLDDYPAKRRAADPLFADLLRRLQSHPDDASAIMSNNYRTVLRALEAAIGLPSNREAA